MLCAGLCDVLMSTSSCWIIVCKVEGEVDSLRESEIDFPAIEAMVCAWNVDISPIESSGCSNIAMDCWSSWFRFDVEIFDMSIGVLVIFAIAWMYWSSVLWEKSAQWSFRRERKPLSVDTGSSGVIVCSRSSGMIVCSRGHGVVDVVEIGSSPIFAVLWWFERCRVGCGWED